MTLLGGQVIFGTPVFGVTAPTISIGLSSLSPIDLTPDHFGSTSQIVSVTTDNYTGYTATLNNPNNSTGLINATDNTLIIPTITLPADAQSITVSAFTSGYGISTDGTNYVPAPTSVSSILINSSNTAGTSSHTITFGAKPATNTPSGTYTKTFVVTAVVNNPQYSITYNANAGTDTVTGMPPNQSAAISNTGTATLSDNVPVRTDYNFLGWDADGTVTTPTYPTGVTNTITLEPTQANAISLYAIWEYSPQIIADYTETFSEATGPTASVSTDLTSGGTGMQPSEYITKIFAYANNTGRTISSITVEITYTKPNQGATSGYLIGKLNVNGVQYTASPVAVPRDRVRNPTSITLAQFNNLNIPSSNNISFTIGADSDEFTAGIYIHSQIITVTFAD